MDDLFDAAAMYDEDYLYFFAAPGTHSEFAAHGPAVPGAGGPAEDAADLAWRLAGLRPGLSVLDLACGHGQMANRLATRGCQVTGLDSSQVFLDRARADADADAAKVNVEYVTGDLRQLPWTHRFDRVLNWPTAFGYFDDTTNRTVLDEIVRVLRGRPASRSWTWTT
jgi:SAM-dependent methyltransferase